jgi:hypothetical protein
MYSKLPSELYYSVLEYLEPKDLSAATSVNRFAHSHLNPKNIARSVRRRDLRKYYDELASTTSVPAFETAEYDLQHLLDAIVENDVEMVQVVINRLKKRHDIPFVNHDGDVVYLMWTMAFHESPLFPRGQPRIAQQLHSLISTYADRDLLSIPKSQIAELAEYFYFNYVEEYYLDGIRMSNVFIEDSSSDDDV